VKRPLSVQKFGSSVLDSEADLARAVHAIYADVRAGYSVLAVVSALGGTTDALLAEARATTPAPDPRVLARLLATGEARSAALLSLAVERVGLSVGLLGSENAGILTEGPLLDAEPIGLDAEVLLGELERAQVVVLPGFVGRRVDGELALLGRGGSDLTAVFVAGRLGAARCVLFKDVDGLFEWDPAAVERGLPRRYQTCSYADALALEGGIVQEKAVTTARALGLAFEVGSLFGTAPTRVSAEASSWSNLGCEGHAETPGTSTGKPPLRVALLGLGTVGGGVLEHVLAEPELFTVTRVLVRDLDKHVGARRATDLGLTAEVFTTDFGDILACDPDLVVEAIGGVEPAGKWMAQCLAAGIDVVTANKAACSIHGQALQVAAFEGRALLGFAAAVGGVTPALETARRLAGGEPDGLDPRASEPSMQLDSRGAGRAIEHGRSSTAQPEGAPTDPQAMQAFKDPSAAGPQAGQVRGLEGVLNGTSSFVLDRLAAGVDLSAAIAEAQSRGFAEADPSLDLDGRDVAHKLELLVAAAFPGMPVEWRSCSGLEAAAPGLFEGPRQGVVRLVARAILPAGGGAVELDVGPRALAPGHPLGNLEGAQCGVSFTLDGAGVVTVSGTGAGRWPTAESVFADLLAVATKRNREPDRRRRSSLPKAAQKEDS